MGGTWRVVASCRNGFVPSTEFRRIGDTGNVGVCLLLRDCAVVIALLLLIAGDVERNPGPTMKEGSDQVNKVLPTVDDTPLGEDDHFDILTEMTPVAGSWKTIGRGLRLDSGRLETINASNPGKPIDCLSDMIACWLKRNYNVERFGEPTWQAVVKVVAHPAAGDNSALALNIAKQHLGTVVSAAVSQSTKQTEIQKENLYASKPILKEVIPPEGVSPGHSSSIRKEETQKSLVIGSPTSSSFSYFNGSGLTPEQQEGLSIRLCVETEDIMHKFWCLHSRVYESLRQQNVSVDRLVTHLLSLGAFDPVYKDSQKPLLKAFSQELQDAGSIEKVLYIIRDYISFFNFNVIKHIVDGLGTDQDRFELQKYEDEFDQYSKRRIYECPPVYGSVSSAGHTDLVLKLDSVYEEFTVKELRKFQYRLSRILCVSPQSVLRLCRVEEGCLQLIFQVPSFVQQEIFPLSSQQEEALAAEGVISLTCRDYQFTAKGDERESEPEDSKLRGRIFQGVRTIQDFDVDSAKGTSIITDDKSSCKFSDSEEDKEDEVDQFEDTPRIFSRKHIPRNTFKLLLAARRGDLETVRFLTDKKHQKPLQKDEHGNTALHAAAQGGSLDVLKYFINEKNCNPTCHDHCERTPLHVATEHAHLDVINYLVTEQQVEPLCQDEDGWTPLHLSCKNGCLNSVKLLTEELEKYEPMKDLMPSLTTKEESTPLHTAALNGHLDIVKFFITDLKCSPNISGMYGCTPLHYAAQEGHLHIMKYLIDDQGCDPSCLDTDQETPLHHAAREGHLHIIKYLIDEQRCYSSSLNRDKETPLHFAAYGGHLDIVKFLTLEKHCNPTLRNSFGSTPIHWAAQYGHLEILKIFTDDLNCSSDIPGQSGLSPLHYAAQEGHLHVMKYLIDDQGCDPSCLDTDQKTPLHHAARKGHLHIIKYLIDEQRCYSSCLNRDKETPLHLAAYGGHLDIVKFLTLGKHCNPTLKNSFGSTPVHWAAQYGHLEILKIFTDDLNCSPDIPDQSGYTPLHYAAQEGHLHIMKYLIDEQGCGPSCLDI